MNNLLHSPIQEIIAQQSHLFPDNVAIERGSLKMTYGELDHLTNSIAHLLLNREAQKGSFVGIVTENSVEMIVSIIAILKAGCCFIPLNFNYTEIKEKLAIVTPKFMMTTPSYIDELCKISTEISLTTDIIDISLPQPNASSAPKISWHLGETCYIYFTSGSSGKPKAIAGRLESLGHFIRWQIDTFSITAKTRISQLTNPTFDAFLRDIFTPLCAGATVCVPENAWIVGDGSILYRWLEQAKIEMVHSVPSIFRLLLHQNLTPKNLPDLRYILLSGEVLLPIDIKQWCDIFADRIRLVNLYGPSETTMIKFYYLVNPEDQKLPSIPIGKTLPQTQAFLLDESQLECTTGKVGEIYIKTSYSSNGYYRDIEATKAAFIPDPRNNQDQELVYKTGDYGRVLNDGNFEFLGRKDRQVKIRGARIELDAIEKSLRQISQIKEVAVVACEDVQRNKYLCAYVVLEEILDMDVLKEKAKKLLLEVNMPSRFVFLPMLPRTLSGKVDKKRLPPPGILRKKMFVAAETLTEIELAKIWSPLLGIPKISVYDDFLELGGHSLLATQILSRINEKFGIEISLGKFFEKRTIAELAIEITEQQLVSAHSEEDITKMIADITNLSEEELDKLLEDDNEGSK